MVGNKPVSMTQLTKMMTPVKIPIDLIGLMVLKKLALNEMTMTILAVKLTLNVLQIANAILFSIESFIPAIYSLALNISKM